MSETTEKEEPKKAPAKKAAPKPKVPLRARGKFADQFEDDGYEVGYLDVKAFHQWNKGSDFRIFCEHPDHGKPTPIVIKEGGRTKTWKRVWYKMQNEYHKLNVYLDENGEEKENKEEGFSKSWTPIYEGDE